MLPLPSRPLPRLCTLLAVSCLGTGIALVGGRELLRRRPPLTPLHDSASLQAIWRHDLDPLRRREAALLLEARANGDPARQRQLLRQQGWGPDPLAALVLKLDARAAEALGQHRSADRLWHLLLRRFPADPASADALYSLGRRQPALRRELLRRFPAHPAALAAALEAGPTAAARGQGLLHLARWGPRWPGAEERLRRACSSDVGSWSASERQQLAAALADLGDAETALTCLPAGARLAAASQLALARSLLRSDPQVQARAVALLLDLASRADAQATAAEAVRLLCSLEGSAAAAAVARLPAPWRAGAAVAARRALAAADPSAALAVLGRWPDDPASRDLQWELARRLLLQADWVAAEALLEAIPSGSLPPPLEARRSFWLGYARLQQGQKTQAMAIWRQLLRVHPGGYYGWRASVRLGEGDLDLQAREQRPAAWMQWQPLASGDPGLDRLWRLAQATEAWETWRQRRGGRRPEPSEALLVEGRLRLAVGDDWTGLAQLEQALLRLPAGQCPRQRQLELALHPDRYGEAFRQEGNRHRLAAALLQGVAKQESRFTPGVHSAVGAVGLMQLMPETAAELAGRTLSSSELEQPQRNIALGSLYLAGLLRQWQGDPLLAVASYNAGPGAVAGWINPRLHQAPELWVEAIPYPETRLYVKKVLGNAWSYQQRRLPACS